MGAGAAGPRGGEAREKQQSPPPARPAPAAAFTVPDAAQQTAPPPSSPPADPPHLDLPTPLSPMMRIFRVVSTSSSILTPLRCEPSWPPGSGSQPFTGERCPRMRSAARLPPSFLPGCLGCRSPGRPSSALGKLCVCANSVSRASFRRAYSSSAQAQKGRAACDFALL